MEFLDSALLTAERTAEGLSYFGAVIFMLFVGKFIYNRTTKHDFDEELTEKDNVAFAVSLVGYIGGLAIALSGALQATGQGLYWDWIGIGITGLIAILFMRLSVLINDKLILYKFDNNKEIIEDRNLGTGFVQGGSCLATGFMLAGVLASASTSFVDRLIDVGIYWAIGQALLVIGGIVFQFLTSYDVHETLEHDDNAAAGLSFGGFLVAIGLIANAALRGASSNILAELPTIAIWAFVGICLLGLMRVITDKVFLPKSTLSHEIKNDKNVGAGAVAAVGFLSVALLFGTAVNPASATKSNVFEAEAQNSPPQIHLLEDKHIEIAPAKARTTIPAHKAQTTTIVIPIKDRPITTPKVSQ